MTYFWGCDACGHRWTTAEDPVDARGWRVCPGCGSDEVRRYMGECLACGKERSLTKDGVMWCGNPEQHGK